MSRWTHSARHGAVTGSAHQVDAKVNYVPEPGVIGIFIELDDGH
jgi:hypothetical protein